MTQMEYLPGRLGGLMFALILVGILAIEGRPFLRANWKGLCLSFLVMLWWMAPFIRYCLANLKYVIGRGKELSLLGEIQRTGNFDLLWQKWAWTFLSFFHLNPSADLRFSAKAPMFDPVCGALFLFGTLLVVLAVRNRSSWFILSGLFFGLFANAMAVQGQDPDPTYINGQRFFIVVPFVFLAVARAMEALLGTWREAKAPLRWGLGGLFLLSCVFALHWNAKLYYKGFRDFKACTSYWGDLGFNHIQVGEYINENFPRCHMVVDWEYNSSTVQVLIRGKAALYPLSKPFTIPILQKVDRNVLLMVLAWNFKDLQEAIRKTYPRAVWGSIPDVIGAPALLTIEIPKDDIWALQEGKPTLAPLP
jgi:hypothetical protein